MSLQVAERLILIDILRASATVHCRAAGLGRSHRCAAAGPDRRPARRRVDAAGAAGEQL